MDLSIFTESIEDLTPRPSKPGNGQRAIADDLEFTTIEYYSKLPNFIPASGAKSTDDFSVLNADGIRYMVDVKTQDLGRSWSMPNLISMKKLFKFIEDDSIELLYYIIKYEHIEFDTGWEVQIVSKTVVPIYHINFAWLGIGALGNGQLQIKNMAKAADDLYNKSQTKEDFKDYISELYNLFIDKQVDKWTKLKQTR